MPEGLIKVSSALMSTFVLLASSSDVIFLQLLVPKLELALPELYCQ